MTRLHIDIGASDDESAVRVLQQLMNIIATTTRIPPELVAAHHIGSANVLKPGYSTGDLIGSSVCTVTREADPPKDKPCRLNMTPEQIARFMLGPFADDVLPLRQATATEATEIRTPLPKTTYADQDDTKSGDPS